MTTVLERDTPATPKVGRNKSSQPGHLTPTERVAKGKAARALVPRSSTPVFETPPARPDPVALLEEQAVSRVQELVPIRYGRMLASPFAFFRGAALIMASDLATIPHSNLFVQACGDAHMSNFGVFASPERKLVFDVNDFDETLPGPWEWDLRRLTASLAIAGRDRGFTTKERATAVLAAAEGYRVELGGLAAIGNLDVWYRHLDVDAVVTQLRGQAKAGLRRRTEEALQKARTRDSMQALTKLTHVVDGQIRIASDPPLLVPIEELGSEADAQRFWDGAAGLLSSYRRTLGSDRRHLLEQFRMVHIARKVVGVGSVGTRAWVILMLGRDEGDPLFLQAKEAQPSVLERFVGKSKFRNQGERVVAGQHLMQAASDIFLGWEQTDGIDGVRRDFYVRQLRDWKGSIDPAVMVQAGMTMYARFGGSTLARAHARSGDRVATAAYPGNGPAFDRTLVSFSESYADRNQLAYELLQKAVARGRVVARTGL